MNPDLEKDKVIEAFLKSRKTDTTRQYTKMILEYLINEATLENQGYIRARDLKESLVSPEKIPNSSSFYDLLRDLEKEKIIEKIKTKKIRPQKGKNPVYYKAMAGISQSALDSSLSREGLINKCQKYHEENTEMLIERACFLEIIRTLSSRFGIEEVIKVINELKDRQAGCNIPPFYFDSMGLTPGAQDIIKEKYREAYRSNKIDNSYEKILNYLNKSRL